MTSSLTFKSLIHFEFFIYFYFFGLRRVLVAAQGIFVEARGIFRCGARASLQLCCGGSRARGLCSLQHTGLVAPQHVGSQFPDQGSNPCPLHWKADSLPLDHQGSSNFEFIFVYGMRKCSNFILFFFINLFIYFWLRWVFIAACGLFSSCGEQELLLVVVRGLLIAVASLIEEHRLQEHGLSSCGSQALECRLSSCGTQAQLLHGMWDLPGPGLEPVSPALAGGFSTTVPPAKP